MLLDGVHLSRLEATSDNCLLYILLIFSLDFVLMWFQNPVNKNDYLGEYTGELISHKEADKRGKIYDRTNSSFLFDLNDQVRFFF